MPAKRPAYGLWSVGLLLAFTALTALSVIWSVQPDESFKDAGRMLAYSRACSAPRWRLPAPSPTRWPAVLGGVTLAAVVVCCYALLTKVLPRQFDANDVYARLRAPYDYWNATGLTAAMGVICCLWLGARRAGHAVLSALAYPAMGLMLVTLMLAYSRGALVALALGLAAVVLPRPAAPARRHGAARGRRSAPRWWSPGTSRRMRSALKVSHSAHEVTAGRQLGALLVAMLILLTIVGLAVGFLTARRAPSRRLRRRAGAALLTILAVVVIAAAGALAVSHRGLPGSISHAFPLAHRHECEGLEHARPPDRHRERARALLEARRSRCSKPTRCSERARKGTERRACATAARRWKSGTHMAFSCRRLPIWGWSG